MQVPSMFGDRRVDCAGLHRNFPPAVREFAGCFHVLHRKWCISGISQVGTGPVQKSCAGSLIQKAVYSTTLAGAAASLGYPNQAVNISRSGYTRVKDFTLDQYNRCPKPGYKHFNRVCYKYFDDEKNYDEAKDTCVADGGMLAMPKDSETNNFIAGLGEGSQRWIGLTGSVGQWVFEDGQTLVSSGYSNWHPVCPTPGYEHFNGLCYKYFDDEKTYDEAKETCATDGGILAMPKDSETNNFTAGLENGDSVRENRWIGLTDAPKRRQYWAAQTRSDRLHLKHSSELHHDTGEGVTGLGADGCSRVAVRDPLDHRETSDTAYNGVFPAEVRTEYLIYRLPPPVLGGENLLVRVSGRLHAGVRRPQQDLQGARRLLVLVRTTAGVCPPPPYTRGVLFTNCRYREWVGEGKTCRFTCRDGYFWWSGGDSRTCNGGSWSGTPMRCEIAGCNGQLPPLWPYGPISINGWTVDGRTEKRPCARTSALPCNICVVFLHFICKQCLV
ncbi:COLEC10 [Branchiostoma lanceolatum]|uniref:COLEC10 protein n=1 Tax=Branchiostoma lanceolatum TaxID=7740 RepID=A0A8J9ZZG3_BRALA|nr:COLEC10 [Branchiostoma lanceolatum]